MTFTEEKLEKAILQLLSSQSYPHVKGSDIPREPGDVLIKEDLKTFLSRRYADDNITSGEIASIIRRLELFSASDLYESNKNILKMLSDGFLLKREDRKQKDLYIQLIDYSDLADFRIPDADKLPTVLADDSPAYAIGHNIFKIVNQLEITGYEKRIPDALLYINGLPLVVFEFKSAIREECSIHDAYRQLTIRYRRDIPELFKYNAFCVISDGVNNKAGSFFAPYEFFYSWRRTGENDTVAKDGIDSLYTMIQGLFHPLRLRNVLRNFIFFPDTSAKQEKIFCRYPQYYAAVKLYENIRRHRRPEGDGKGGTYFGATGCGKSYTMLFLTRLLMKSLDFGSPTIVLITDRTDLDDQLSTLFTNAKGFIGDEAVISAESRAHLRELLKDRDSGGVFLTTIHKFTEDTELLTDRSNVICISDEAHRSQVNLDQKVRITENGVRRSFGFAKYLHDSLPNASYVGFTGTPVDATLDVFGPVVDAYTMMESVKDEITVPIVYEGRAAKVLLDNSRLQEIEDYYAQCEQAGASEYQIEESKKASAKMDVILGDPDRIQAIAEDFVCHYEKRVAEGASVKGKAIFVSSSRMIAYELHKALIALRPEWAEIQPNAAALICRGNPPVVAPAEGRHGGQPLQIFQNLYGEVQPLSLPSKKEKNKDIKPIEKLKMVMTRGKDDPPELWEMLGTREDRKELDRQFKVAESNFSIAIVVDMWLTGFDVPLLDTIYIDKPIQRHSLIQTISRVNRKSGNKEKGLVVDYIGIKRQMNQALALYSKADTENFEDMEQSVVIVKDHLDLLGKIFHKFNSKAYFTGYPLLQLECLKLAAEFVQLTRELEKRFMHLVKRMKAAYDICCGSEAFSQKERDTVHFYLAVRSIVFKLTKGEAPDTAQMNARVREMIKDALASEGVEEIFKMGQESGGEINIFDADYLSRIEKIKLPNTKIKLLKQLLAKAISDFKKVNRAKGTDFSEKFQALVQRYNERKEQDVLVSNVLEDFSEEIIRLYHALRAEMDSFHDLGIDFEEKAFYDILRSLTVKYEFEYPEDRLTKLAKAVKKVVDDKAKYTDWSQREDIKAELKVDLIILLAEHGYPPVDRDEVYKEIFEQAENFRKYRQTQKN